ncbi:MAG: MgtC/SapB family protein [Clostridia bacterium]|nr:MgtC/SapB family protein [Clostridia bacterium]
MGYEYYIEVLIRLAVAVVLGGIIGIERSGTRHDAGLRTHILVCLGAAGITLLSEVLLMDGYSTDVSRLGAQVISGIGFLGAGCILVTGNKVKGLTTAAGLWTTACVGLATGMGYFFISITITAFMLIAMLALRPLANRFKKKADFKERQLKITIKNRQSIQTVTNCIIEHECNILSMVTIEEELLNVKISKTTEENATMLIGSLMENKDIKNVELV